MSRTTILPGDPNKRKAWAAKVADDSEKDIYWSRLIGPEGSDSVIVRKVDLEKGRGDEVVTALVAKLRGTPRVEGEKLAGNEFRLSHASHTMRVNEFRQGVNCGADIEQTRVGFNLRRQGREKLTGYITEFSEEVICMALSGARGTGDEIQHFGTDWTGYPNAFRAPDIAHQFFGTDNSVVKNTMLAGSKVNLDTINKLRVKAKKMLGGQPDKAVRMMPTTIGGKKLFVLAACPEVMQDIRSDVSAQGWWEAQKALIQKIGKDAEVFKGGAGEFNGVLVDEMDTCVKFNDYGAGANIPAARSLLLSANAGAIGFGTKGMADGLTVELGEDSDDREHDHILYFELIMGADKCVYNLMDYGVISVDTAFSASV
jgi:N4-gp56 family major capsid protein